MIETLIMYKDSSDRPGGAPLSLAANSEEIDNGLKGLLDALTEQ